MVVLIQHRRDTAANWTTHNPLIPEGQLCVEKGTWRYKIGNGVDQWNDLPYAVFDGFTSGHRYTFQDDTGDADPGAGNVRFNHATFASITELYFDNTDASNGDASAWLDTFDDSTNTTKGVLRIEKQDDPDVYRSFTVTGSVVDGTGYRKVTVTPLAQAGSLADADAVVVTFITTGNAGTIGSISDGGSLDDNNGNELLEFGVTGSAVNHVKTTNAAAGNAPSLAAVGDGTDIDLELTPKGAGNVTTGGDAILPAIDEDDMASDSDDYVPTQQSVKAYADLRMPVGALMDYAGAAAPSGWILCYGQAISRTTYAALFTAIGTVYGAGDGSTTFNLPDLRGRVVAGQDDMGGTSANRLTGQSGGVNGDNLGAAGGAETHQLTTAQLPAHTHPAAFGSFIMSTTGGGNAAGGTGGGAPNTGSTGSDQAHNNVQPTIVLNKIIFAGA